MPIVDDLALEETETVNVTLSNPAGGAVLGSLTTAQIAIHDNDGLVRQVQIRDRVGAVVHWQIEPGHPSWLSFTKTSGTGPSTIIATASVVDLAVGTHEGVVIVTGDTGDSPQIVRAILVVQPPPLVGGVR